LGKGEIDTLTGGSGTDTFVLGENGDITVDNGTRVPIQRNSPAIYYLGKGDSDYALITDFTVGEDVILLSEDLISQGSLTFAGESSGTEILFDNDLIAIVEGVSSVDLLLGNSFSFV
jgi:Ca2+-binding RTX toxin-like protein